jgi:hypothetical protein
LRPVAARDTRQHIEPRQRLCDVASAASRLETFSRYSRERVAASMSFSDAQLDESVEMKLDATTAEKRKFNDLAELFAILQGPRRPLQP